MPITLFEVGEWHPDRASSHLERTKHVAYHMEHYIRRMPTRAAPNLRKASHHTACHLPAPSCDGGASACPSRTAFRPDLL